MTCSARRHTARARAGGGHCYCPGYSTGGDDDNGGDGDVRCLIGLRLGLHAPLAKLPLLEGECQGDAGDERSDYLCYSMD